MAAIGSSIEARLAFGDGMTTYVPSAERVVVGGVGLGGLALLDMRRAAAPGSRATTRHALGWAAREAIASDETGGFGLLGDPSMWTAETAEPEDLSSEGARNDVIASTPLIPVIAKVPAGPEDHDASVLAGGGLRSRLLAAASADGPVVSLFDPNLRQQTRASSLQAHAGGCLAMVTAGDYLLTVGLRDPLPDRAAETSDGAAHSRRVPPLPQADAHMRVFDVRTNRQVALVPLAAPHDLSSPPGLSELVFRRELGAATSWSARRRIVLSYLPDGAAVSLAELPPAAREASRQMMGGKGGGRRAGAGNNGAAVAVGYGGGRVQVLDVSSPAEAATEQSSLVGSSGFGVGGGVGGFGGSSGRRQE